MPSSPASNETIAAVEKLECAVWAVGSVTPSRTSPSAVQPRPIHCRRPTSKPKSRSAMTASSTTPPASTDWTTDIGASANAATWKTQAQIATNMPIANHFELHSDLAECSGWRMSTGSA